MNYVGRLGSFISQGVYSVATPFHPFGGAVDIIVVKQKDGTYRSTPWYIRFGKFQGVLRGPEKVIRISVNGLEADFQMYLDSSGQAYFMREDGDDDAGEGVGQTNSNIDSSHFESSTNDQGSYLDGRNSAQFEEEQISLEGSGGTSRSSSLNNGRLDETEDNRKESDGSNSEMVLVVNGQVLTAPISTTDASDDNVQLSITQFHLGPADTTSREFTGSGDIWETHVLGDPFSSDGNDELNNIHNWNSEGAEHRTGLLEDQEEAHNLDMDLHEGDDKCVAEECKAAKICIGEHEGNGNEDTILDDVSCRLVKSDTFKSCLDLSQVDNDEQEIVESIHSGWDQSKSNRPNRRVSFDEKNLGDGTLDRSNLSQHIDSGKEGFRLCAENDDGNGGKEEQPGIIDYSPVGDSTDHSLGFEISLCGNLLRPHMGSESAQEVFDAYQIRKEHFEMSGPSIVNNRNLIVRADHKYFPWSKNAHFIIGKALFGQSFTMALRDVIPVEPEDTVRRVESFRMPPSPSRAWRLWPLPFRRSISLQRSNSNLSSDEFFLDALPCLSPNSEQSVDGRNQSPRKNYVRTNLPTSEQILSLNLQEGQNLISFSFSTRVLGKQQVDAHIYLWNWNTRIVVSDVDGTITKSDVLGQVMPLVGRDWSQSGVTRLFSSIKKNGYQLLFLSARAIVQAYLTKSFLFNLKQDGETLPNGPVVISPDGLFPSLFREVVRRAPHEFKIACLQDIRALFPDDYNPFYAGFGNRDTDELSYRKIGIPKGKIFIINPKGEVAINSSINVKSYSSLHTLVNDMFPPTSMVEQEDYNSWNYWKMPLPEIDL